MDFRVNEYYSPEGMSTRHWGKAGWDFLFTSVLGSYPVEIDMENQEHLKTRDAYRSMMESLCYTMPCIYCRESYKIFIKELPIDRFLSGRIKLMYWLYLIKDKVNKKLIAQELECISTERKKLMQSYKNNEISAVEFNKMMEEKRKEIFYTKKSPPFEQVLKTYEKLRASCSPQQKSCAILKTG